MCEHFFKSNDKYECRDKDGHKNDDDKLGGMKLKIK